MRGVSVVALNALIAIMGSTYGRVEEAQQAVTYQVRARDLAAEPHLPTDSVQHDGAMRLSRSQS